MRRLSFALGGLAWAAGLALTSIFVITLVGITPLGIALAAAMSGLLFLPFFAWAWRGEARAHSSISDMGQALGCAAKGNESIEDYVADMVANLCKRLERSAQFKTAFSALKTPALILDADGDVHFASEGLTGLAPDLAPGANLSDRLGENWQALAVADEDGAPQKPIRLALGGRPYDATIAPLGGNRFVICFMRAGLIVGAKHLAAFSDALAAGQTGFRFAPRDEELFPALGELNIAMDYLDQSVKALDHAVAEGGTSNGTAPFINAGLAAQVGAVRQALGEMSAAREAETERRARLEHKLNEIARLIDQHQKTLARIGNLAMHTRDGAEEAYEVFAQGHMTAKHSLQTAKDAAGLALEANGVSQKAETSITDMQSLASQIDKMMVTIEDVSFRTNLLALNAAVEAARAGDKGAGFAVVADEVRTLAHTTSQSAREIRDLARKGAVVSEEGREQVGEVARLITAMEDHLRKISNDAGIVAGSMEDGVRALDGVRTSAAAMAEEARTGDDDQAEIGVPHLTRSAS